MYDGRTQKSDAMGTRISQERGLFLVRNTGAFALSCNFYWYKFVGSAKKVCCEHDFCFNLSWKRFKQLRILWLRMLLMVCSFRNLLKVSLLITVFGTALFCCASLNHLANGNSEWLFNWERMVLAYISFPAIKKLVIITLRTKSPW